MSRPQTTQEQNLSRIFADEAEELDLQETKLASTKECAYEQMSRPHSSSTAGMDTPTRDAFSSTASLSTCGTSQPQSPRNNPAMALHASLLSGKFSDLTITHGKRSWKAHKVIVCSHSPVLAVEIEELIEPAVLDLSHYNLTAVGHVLEFFYTSNYATIDGMPAYSLPTHITVFRLASTLQIPGLQERTAQRFRHNLNHYVTDLNVYFTAIKEVYANTTPDEPALRLAVAETASMEMVNLLAGDVRVNFLRVTSEVPDFQADIYMALLTYNRAKVEFVVAELCDDCGPRDVNDAYKMDIECKGCGQKKTLDFV
ncbi:hypothetical protein BJ875DRAFT_488906 [Amylocarpus encephaloides]|uniref:BTB domain-containing protein n=1 Tax=Amylocarpus encephaloides TaxID=45428 RepID=A0A9P7YAF1_9HELO|nr:hypothetical protein BJ875DRAFT_488906 [Amylocarpus encephaloides]